MPLTLEKKISILKATVAINKISQQFVNKRNKQKRYLQKSFSSARRRNEKQRTAAERSIVAALKPFFNKQITSVASGLEALSIKTEKHGSHDQLTHGRGRSGGAGSGAIGKEAMAAETAGNATYLQKEVAGINSWMKSESGLTDEPELEVTHGRFHPKSDVKDGRAYVTALRTKSANSVSKKINISKEDLDEYTDDDGRKHSSKESAVNAIIDSWNYDAQGTTGVALQSRAAAKFGISGASVNDRKQAAADEYLNKGSNKKVVDAAVDAIYETTQSRLSEMGVKELAVYRGSSSTHGFSKEGTVDSVKMNALSSFTTSISQAERFSRDEERLSGSVVGGVVKAKDVFSIPSSGIGTVTESEVVVMHRSNRKMKARSHDSIELGYDPKTDRTSYQDVYPNPKAFWSDE